MERFNIRVIPHGMYFKVFRYTNIPELLEVTGKRVPHFQPLDGSPCMGEIHLPLKASKAIVLHELSHAALHYCRRKFNFKLIKLFDKETPASHKAEEEFVTSLHRLYEDYNARS